MACPALLVVASRLCVVLLAVLFVTVCAPASAAERLNVLLITADDLGPLLGCYGNRLARTPHLDALAASGVRFETAYVAQASCSPSRSAMFTGLFPHTNGQYGLANTGLSLHPQYRDATLPNLLKKAGYRTGIVGKLHVEPEKSFAFDVRPKLDMRDVRQAAAEAAAFWKEGGQQPFFLMVNYTDPHALRDSGTGSGFPGQVKGLPEEPLTAADVPAWPFQGVDDETERERIAGYYNCILRLDVGIGLLLEALQASGRAEDTLVIFLGDHGPPFCRGKTTCYEAGLRVPFLVRWPGVSQPLVSPAMVSAVDIVPTVLDAAGVAPPDGLQGRSLRPVVSNAQAPWREHLAAEFHCHGASPFYPRRAIRDARYKLIHNLRAGEAKPNPGIDGDPAFKLSQAERYAGTATRAAMETFAAPPEFELYDLQSDPFELKNVAGQADLAQVERKLKQALVAWRQETHDPFLEAKFTAATIERLQSEAAKAKNEAAKAKGEAKAKAAK